jgi:hypothetical protein
MDMTIVGQGLSVVQMPIVEMRFILGKFAEHLTTHPDIWSMPAASI